MSDTGFNRKAYKMPTESVVSTVGNDKEYEKKSIGSDMFVNLANHLPIPRLFLILAFVVYGVIAFSKKDQGVVFIDLAIFGSFIIFISLIFILLIIGRDLYRGNENMLVKNIFSFVEKNINKVCLLILIAFVIYILR